VMSAQSRSQGVLYMIVCGAPAAAKVGEFVGLAQRSGWLIRVIATPMGERFIDVSELAALTGDRVRTGFRMPDEPDELPAASAVVVAPATFNTVNKWAAGIADTFATGLLCELTGMGVPIVAVPLVKDALARHLAFGRSLDQLRRMGVRVLFDPQAPPGARMPSWPRVLEELQTVTSDRPDGKG
jgi:phosphopantothenoylcysteine synthetase/decarboxylase